MKKQLNLTELRRKPMKRVKRSRQHNIRSWQTTIPLRRMRLLIALTIKLGGPRSSNQSLASGPVLLREWLLDRVALRRQQFSGILGNVHIVF